MEKTHAMSAPARKGLPVNGRATLKDMSDWGRKKKKSMSDWSP